MSKEKIGIITDEAADLPKEIIEKHRIAVVPVKLFWPEIENLPGENIFQKMREMEKKGVSSFGKTSQPSMKDFLDKYDSQLEIFEKVLCFTLTSKLSGTYNSAVQAKRFLAGDRQNRVFLIDSLSASAGQALLILKAIELIEKGKSAEEIFKELSESVPKIHLHIIFENAKWVEASGRISHLVANLMKGMAKMGVRPVLTFKDGILAPAGLKTGAKDIADGIFKQFESDMKRLNMPDKEIKAVITHGDDMAGAERLKAIIEKDYKNVKIAFINILNNVVGSLAGPNTLVLAWLD